MLSADTILFGPFLLVPGERLLLKHAEAIPLGSRAMDVLLALVETAGQVVGQRELVARAWPNIVVGDGSLRVTIAELRKALGEGQDGVRYITNVTGRGYCFVAPIERPAASPQSSAAIPLPHHRVPPRLVRMVGRDDAVKSLAELLKSRRFVSIVGPGGMGKTTVAIALAHHLLGQFPNAVYFVDLGTLTDARLVTSAVAAELGLSVQTQDAMPSVKAFLAQQRGLLVLDNCEHVVDAASALAEQLHNEAPKVHILTTTREALRIEGEYVYLLSPLDCPLETPSLTALDAMASPAVQLFMDRAFASGHSSQLTDAEAPIVAAICGRLDGIALAIELAASRVGAYGLQGTADLLSNRFKLLWQGRRTAPPRHQTLHAMLDWSVNLLSERDRWVLTRLSVFVGAFTLDAAQAVVSAQHVNPTEVLESLASLVGKSLVSVSRIEGAPAYRLLDSTVAYAAEKLARLDEANDVARQHAEFFSEWCLNVAPGQFRTLGQGALPATEPHLGNIRAALEWSFSESGDNGIAIRLAAGAVPLFFEISLLTECRRWCEAGLAALVASDANDRIKLVFQSTLAAAAMFAIGNSDEVLNAIEASLELAESLDDKRHEMHLLAGLNVFYTRVGDFDEAVAVAERSVEVAEDLGSTEAKATSAWMLGVSYHLAGDQAPARVHLERGLALATDLAPAQVMFFGYNHRVRALVALARTLWLGGFPDQAAVTAQRAVDEANMQAHPVILCMAQIYSITVFLWNGSFEKAETLVKQLIAHASTHALGPYRNVGLALSGELAVRRGDVAAGIPVLKHALERLKVEKYNTLSPVIHAAIVTGLMELGDDAAASALLKLASDRVGATTTDIYAPELLRLRGELCRNAGGDPTAAEEAFRIAGQTAKSQSALSFELRSAMSLARLWSSMGKRREAVDLLQEVYGRFTEGFETADLRNAEDLLEDLGHDLGARGPGK